MRVAEAISCREILHCIPTALAAALNETFGLSALPGMELHANLQAAL